MLKSIVEQKMALAAYAIGKDIFVLSSAQLDLAEKVISTLGPIDEIANSILANSASVSVSVVIPFVRMTLRTRYSNVEDNEYLVLATLLDPQFKGKFFSGAIERSASKQMLEDKMK